MQIQMGPVVLLGVPDEFFPVVQHAPVRIAIPGLIIGRDSFVIDGADVTGVRVSQSQGGDL